MSKRSKECRQKPGRDYPGPWERPLSHDLTQEQINQDRAAAFYEGRSIKALSAAPTFDFHAYASLQRDKP
jgi:hypothetical protein